MISKAKFHSCSPLICFSCDIKIVGKSIFHSLSCYSFHINECKYMKHTFQVSENHINILAFWENNQSFYSIVDFFVCFATLRERNFPRWKNPTFRWIRVKWFLFGRCLWCGASKRVHLFFPPLVALIFFPLLEGNIGRD